MITQWTLNGYAEFTTVQATVCTLREWTMVAYTNTSMMFMSSIPAA